MVPPRVLRAMSRQMVYHRTPSFAKALRENSSGLKKVFQTSKDVLTFPGSGTGGLEAAIVNLFSPGDKILSVSGGAFGLRFRDIARNFGAHVISLDNDWGGTVDPAQVNAKLKSPDGQNVCAILATHTETSTGVTNDIQALAQVAKEHKILLIVDAVSSLGALNIEMDAWGIDAVVTGSHYGLMLPPGLTFIALSEQAWKRVPAATMPRHYWDLHTALESLERGENPYAPAVSLMFGLTESLKMILEEGLANVFQRHQRLGEMMRAGLAELKLDLLPKAEVASNTVSVVKMPPGFETAILLKILREKHQVMVAGGHGPLKGKIIRIGHVGYVCEGDIAATLHAFRRALKEIGYL